MEHLSWNKVRRKFKCKGCKEHRHEISTANRNTSSETLTLFQAQKIKANKCIEEAGAVVQEQL